MIIIESIKKSEASLRKRYPDALLCDVTCRATTGLVRLSPFYPHGNIPVPFSDGYTATCVEAIWQGLKVFEHADIDVSLFRNTSMHHIKRSARQFGRPLGHRQGVHGANLLSYRDARYLIFLSAYRYLLEHYAMDIIQRLRIASQKQTIVLLDFNTNSDVDNLASPLSHAFLVKAYAEGLPPYPDAIGAHPSPNSSEQIATFPAPPVPERLSLFD